MKVALFRCEITGVGAQLGNSEIERACGSWSMRDG
jgi:hypothetical protein